MEKKLKICILSDSPFICTGYSDQSKKLADYLVRKGHSITFLANAYQGTTIEHAKLEGGRELNYKIYGQGRQPYFADKISSHLKETKSDAFFILLDTFMMMQAGFLNIDTSPAQTFFWFPSDGGAGLPVNCSQILNKVEVPVAMAKYGQTQVKDYHNINALHIPHGVDSKMFYRLPDNQRNELRAKWGLSDKFVIGVVARNQPRKFLDRTIKAMSLIDIPNAILLLHLDAADPAQVWDIRNLIKRYNLENKVKFTGMSALKGFPYEEMNDVYNLMDCFFLSTSGEGFGIPIIEAMSCQVPVVATDYTSTPELVINNKAGLGVKLAGTETIEMPLIEDMPEFGTKKYDVTYRKTTMKDYDDKLMNGTITGSWEVERGLMDVKDAAKKIKYIYDNKEEAKQMGENGRKAVLEKYDFETIVGPKWEKLLIEKSKC